MTYQPVGRELDEQVARILGWTKPSERGRCDRCGWLYGEQSCRPDHCSMLMADYLGITRADVPRAYETEPAALNEMLAFARRKWAVLDIRIHKDGVFAEANDDPPPRERDLDYPSGFGATLNLAVARLVVAVAEREGAK